MLGGEPMTEEQIHEAMRVLDTDRNGTIEFDEFQAWWDSDSNEVKIGGLTAAGIYLILRLRAFPQRTNKIIFVARANAH